MRNIFFTAILLFFSKLAFAQFVVADSIDNQVIEFAYMVDNHGIVYGISDKNGVINFSDNSNINDTKFFIVRFGYNKYSIDKNNMADTIFLSAKVEHIKDINIVANKDGTEYYKYYFKTYDTKNDTIRRYIDGIVEYEVNRKEHRIKQRVLQYRSLLNNKMFSNKKFKIIEISYEATGILYYSLHNTLNKAKLFDDFVLINSANNKNLLIIKDKTDKTELGKIYIDSLGREESAYFAKTNDYGKTKKLLGSEGKILLEISEEHYKNTTDNNYLIKRSFIQKSLFRQKRRKEEFGEYMCFLEINFISNSQTPDGRNMKFRRDNSNFSDKFWENSKYAELATPLVSLEHLTFTKNKYKP